MSAGKSSSGNYTIRALIGLSIITGLGACADYTKHRDTITYAAGDSKSWNSVIHTADPWPPYAQNAHIEGDGRRVARVIQRYSTGEENADSAQESSPAETSPSGTATAN
jgi:hypothetical protein